MAHNIPISFKIYSGDQLVRTESLTQDIIKVGKLQSSHLRIDDDNVSRMHAVIEVTSPTEVFIIDLGSASGTIVNGKKVNKAALNSGDAAIEEIRVDLQPEETLRMMELTGRRTVPQIFIGDTHVGGCDDLIALDSAGGLMPLLQD